jgi:regulator of protease activity HflC (stomatin/prohibitin superfamily)
MAFIDLSRRSEGPAGTSLRFARVNIVGITILLACLGAGALGVLVFGGPMPLLAMAIAGGVLMQSPKVAQQWERGVVLKLGRFVGLRGPGLFWIVPFIDRVSSWIDQRTITTSFAAEQTLTSDTVPVNVDAVLFWMVNDAQKAALEVQDYAQAVSWAAQTALRDVIGRTPLTELLRGRERIEADLQQLIDQRSTPWGVTVSSVEMRDIVIPVALQDAMSREAQAAREKQARIILGEAEMEIAHSFQEAAKAYHDNPTALQLRAMNMLYEGLKDKGALMLIPSSAVDSLGMGGMLGAAALRQERLAVKPLGEKTQE